LPQAHGKEIEVSWLVPEPMNENDLPLTYHLVSLRLARGLRFGRVRHSNLQRSFSFVLIRRHQFSSLVVVRGLFACIVAGAGAAIIAFGS
jgi:hypothetical protein